MCKVFTQTYVCVSVHACVQVYVCVYVCACVCFNRLYISYHLDYLNWLKASNTRINFCPQFRCRFCLVIELHLQLLLFFYQSTLYRRKEYWFINSSYIMPIFLSIGFQFSVFPSVEFLYFSVNWISRKRLPASFTSPASQRVFVHITISLSSFPSFYPLHFYRARKKRGGKGLIKKEERKREMKKREIKMKSQEGSTTPKPHADEGRATTTERMWGAVSPPLRHLPSACQCGCAVEGQRGECHVWGWGGEVRRWECRWMGPRVWKEGGANGG